MLELVALGSDRGAAEAAATAIEGRLYVNRPGEGDERPYSTLVRAATDDLEVLSDAADVGLYVCFSRAVKPEQPTPPPERCIASFAMVRHPDLSHRRSDSHWRDTHGPLAVASHSAMCDYTQLSTVATLSGTPLDGIALCAFENRSDLSTKFFNDDAAKRAISEDVAKFADLRRSLRRVVLTERP
jgi:hypothetical protein